MKAGAFTPEKLTETDFQVLFLIAVKACANAFLSLVL